MPVSISRRCATNTLLPALGLLAMALASPACLAEGTDASSAPQQVLPEARYGEGGATRGYVLTRMQNASHKGEDSLDCPKGRSLNIVESLAALPKEQQSKLIADEGRFRQSIADGVLQRNNQAAQNFIRSLKPEVCNDPASLPYFTGFRPIEHGGEATGLNLDGTTDGKETASTCAHKKFTSAGAPIDNQLWRVLGCVHGFRPDGSTEASASSGIESGGYAVLMEITERKDGKPGDVDVALYSSDEAVTLGLDGKIVAGLSLRRKKEPRYHAVTRGRIENNILTTEPVDFTYWMNVQVVRSDQSMRAARLRMEFLPDGRLKGMLGGYYDIDAYYRQRILSMTMGGIFFTGVNCPALYAALKQNADGFRDPATGQCSAVSGAMLVEAIPAFVIPPAVDSAQLDPRADAAGTAGRR